MSYNIAVDGPAGAGKSTISKAVAKKLGFIYVDTGAKYRAIALYFLGHPEDAADDAGLKRALSSVRVGIEYKDGQQKVLLNEEDVTGELRKEAVGNMASRISAKGPVREKLLSLQRELAAASDVIMDGRDIGTTVLPDADVKIYLTAGTHVRARRRYLELVQKGEKADIQRIEEDIRIRDEQDMNRAISPLKQAKDAVLVDSSDMDIPEVIDRIVEIFREKTGWEDKDGSFAG